MDEKMRKYRRGLWAIVCAGILLAASAGVARPVHTEKAAAPPPSEARAAAQAGEDASRTLGWPTPAEVAVAGAGIFLLVVAATGIALCSKT
ncbi:hypothetical protein H8711_06580 [Clostridiaceae bacterium NSJ-31]|uniref:Uncharacterized protein n=3 Tax=Ligaoa zhengdingensis TaxID=2763658 RepID=A0A926E0J4_9FIRM|nr:hypothetical protein [Ligaoa zhengdingensis]MBC8546600.1 hypothetical protein [Ligaoa zhengdingensis]